VIATNNNSIYFLTSTKLLAYFTSGTMERRCEQRIICRDVGHGKLSSWQLYRVAYLAELWSSFWHPTSITGAATRQQFDFPSNGHQLLDRQVQNECAVKRSPSIIKHCPDIRRCPVRHLLGQQYCRKRDTASLERDGPHLLCFKKGYLVQHHLGTFGH